MSIQELEHFGIKGMKWGVRRTPEQLGHRQGRKINRLKKKANRLAWNSEFRRREFENYVQYEKQRKKAPGETGVISLLNPDYVMSVDYRERAQKVIDKIYPDLAKVSWEDVNKQKIYEDIKQMKVPKWARK